MPWNCPLTSLDAEQRAVLDKLLVANNPQWVRGFAGSGKSVILIHALGQLRAINPQATACVVAFTHSLVDMLKSGLTPNAQDVPVMTYNRFDREPVECDYIFVDEVQDLEPRVLNKLRQHARVLFVAGDEEQSIYANRVSPGDIISLVNPQIHSLNVVYRLTEKLKKVVSHILPGSKVHAARNGRLQTNVTITLAKAGHPDQEADWVWKEARRFARIGESAAILIPRHELIQQFILAVARNNGLPPLFIPKNQWGKPDYSVVNDYFAQNGIELRYLGNGHGSLDEGERQRIIYLMTYHSAKGLDFDTVFLPYLNDTTKINKDEALARRLFYVAATRSRRTLSISHCSERPHSLLQGLPAELLDKITIRSGSEDTNETGIVDDIF
jgi:hypothetical protein